jgi:hypothetical protein
MNTTMDNIILDCRDQIHFSRKLLKNYWSTLDTDISIMMNILSEQIFDQFINSFGEINIPSDIDLLDQFVDQANVSNISIIVQKIDMDLTTMELYFEKINSSNSTLPQNLVQTTIDEVSLYKIIDELLDLKFVVVLVRWLCEESA